MDCRYDIVVVGAGPSGSRTACLLARKNLKVCVVEKKKKVGEGVFCTGIVGSKVFHRYNMPACSIASRIDSVVFCSPLGQKLEYEPKEVFAYVVDRLIFDQELFREAQDSGVETFLNQRVSRITRSKRGYTLKTSSRTFHAKAVVLATGVDHRLHGMAGLARPQAFLYGSQVERPAGFSGSRIEVHIGSDFAPGSFGWVVPFRDGISRIGVIVRDPGKKWLKRFIRCRLTDQPACRDADIRVKPIVYGLASNSSNGAIISVGEAAGQVKTTTGGGIHYGLLCAEIAADKLHEALKKGYGFGDYDTTWRSALVAETDIGKKLRSFAARLSDDDLERLFTFAKQNRYWVELLVPRIDFDYHSDVIYFCMESFAALLRLKSK